MIYNRYLEISNQEYNIIETIERNNVTIFQRWNAWSELWRRNSRDIPGNRLHDSLFNLKAICTQILNATDFLLRYTINYNFLEQLPIINVIIFILHQLQCRFDYWNMCGEIGCLIPIKWWISNFLAQDLESGDFDYDSSRKM